MQFLLLFLLLQHFVWYLAIDRTSWSSHATLCIWLSFVRTCTILLPIIQLSGLGVGHIEGVDPNPDNYVCAGIVHTSQAQVGVLIRLEPNSQAQVSCFYSISPLICLANSSVIHVQPLGHLVGPGWQFLWDLPVRVVFSIVYGAVLVWFVGYCWTLSICTVYGHLLTRLVVVWYKASYRLPCSSCQFSLPLPCSGWLCYTSCLYAIIYTYRCLQLLLS